MTNPVNVEKGVMYIDIINKKPKHIEVPGRKKPITFNVPAIVGHSYFVDVTKEQVDVELDYDRGTWHYLKIIDGPVLVQDEKVIDPKKDNFRQQQNVPRNQAGANEQHNSVLSTPATAPYNFVPLNDKVLFVEKEDVFGYHNTYQSERFHGHIHLMVTNKTPLYIRRTKTTEHMRKCEEIAKQYTGKDQKEELRKFHQSLYQHYAPGNDVYKIPGSSLRGMIRNLVTIASYSKIAFFSDKHLFYRAFMDTSTDLVDEYRKAMLGGNDATGYYPLSMAGYLYEEKHEWYIQPATEICRVEETAVIAAGVYDADHKMSRYDDNGKLIANQRYKDMIKGHDYVDVWYQNTVAAPHTHSGGTLLLYAEVTAIQKASYGAIPAGFKTGKLILTEWVNNQRIGKHMHWVIGMEDSTKNPIQVTDIQKQYRDDLTRAKHIDLLQKAKNGNRIPCFYAEVNGSIVAIGHTGMFRMIYEKPISGCMPVEHLEKRIDFTENLFGFVDGASSASGRVFFEDLVITENKGTMDRGCPRILSNPKPTSFQLYLEQPAKIEINPHNEKKTGLHNYNTANAKIRGFKHYWHRDASGWKDEENPQSKQHTVIQPLKEGCVFEGKIRFENLSKDELGALLFVLDLPNGCLHKLGMAKPLGLGSVHISSKLYLSNREHRYESLAYEIDTIAESADSDKFIKAFAEMLQSRLNINMNNPCQEELWKVDRLRNLRIMLDYSHKPEYGKTENLGHPRKFKSRNVLEKPSDLARH